MSLDDHDAQNEADALFELLSDELADTPDARPPSREQAAAWRADDASLADSVRKLAERPTR